jgi:hypothetical protein
MRRTRAACVMHRRHKNFCVSEWRDMLYTNLARGEHRESNPSCLAYNWDYIRLAAPKIIAVFQLIAISFCS